MSRKPLLYSRIVRSDETPKLVVFLIKMKIVRSETQAIILLLLATALFSGLAVYFFLFAIGGLNQSTQLSFPAPFGQEYPGAGNNL